MKRIIVDTRRAPVIKEAFELFATGRYRIMDIADFLAKHNVISRNGNPWRQHNVSHRLLTNPFYYGHFRYAGEIHEGIHEPLITKKLFDQVQEEWRKRSHAWHDELPVKQYTGLFHCGLCGMMITAEVKTKFYKGTNRTATYIYYRCTRKSKTIPCREPFIREENLDRQLSDILQTVSLPTDWAAKMQEKLKIEEADVAQSSRAVLVDKQQELSNITAKLQRLLGSYLDQDIDRDDYRDCKAKLLSEKKTLEESIIQYHHHRTAWLEPMRNWINEASEIPKVARGEDKIAKKVLAQKIFGSNLTLSHRTARGDAREPWAALRAAPTSRNWERRRGIGPPTSTLGKSHSTTELPPHFWSRERPKVYNITDNRESFRAGQEHCPDG